MGASNLIPDDCVVGEISRNALEAEISPSAARSAIRHLKWTPEGDRFVPAHENLRVGDVILSRPHMRVWQTEEIETTQQEYGCTLECSRWTHAMLYVGQLHVAESTKPYSLKTGVAIYPLTAYSGEFDFRVLRYKNEEFSAGRRQNIARYALLNRYVNPRQYDRKAAYNAWLRRRRKGPKHVKSINCSEFVLECFAIAGPYMIDEYVRLLDGTDDYFFPANLAANSHFEHVPMKYYRFDPYQPKSIGT